MATPEETGAAAAAEAAKANDWKSGYEPEVANHPSMASFKSHADVAKSWVNAQKLIGADKIIVPNDKTTDTEWNGIYSKLGRPEKADGYKFSELKPKNIGINADFQKKFSEKAHALGLLPKQVDGMFSWYVNEVDGFEGESIAKRAEFRQTSEASLRNEWGNAFDSKMRAAQEAFNAMSGGDEESAKLLTADIGGGQKLGNHPVFLKIFAKIGESLGEDVLKTGEVRNATMTPDNAKAEMLKVMGDPKGPYFDLNHPEHNLMVQRMLQLTLMANPGSNEMVR